MAYTAFHEKFTNVGVGINAARLATSAIDALRNSLTYERALVDFIHAIDADRGLMWAIAHQYLQARADDMRGTSLTGGQPQSATQFHAAAGHPVEDERATDILRPDPAAPVSSSPVCSGGGHPNFGTQPSRAAPAAKPSKELKLASIARIQEIVSWSVFDTYRVRGRCIGNIPWDELTRIASTNESEARVVRLIIASMENAVPWPGARVRDIVSAKVVNEAIRHASEAANVVA